MALLNLPLASVPSFLTAFIFKLKRVEMFIHF